MAPRGCVDRRPLRRTPREGRRGLRARPEGAAPLRFRGRDVSVGESPERGLRADRAAWSAGRLRALWGLLATSAELSVSSTHNSALATPSLVAVGAVGREGPVRAEVDGGG